jgi:DNA replication licensing factor MCM4
MSDGQSNKPNFSTPSSSGETTPTKTFNIPKVTFSPNESPKNSSEKNSTPVSQSPIRRNDLMTTSEAYVWLSDINLNTSRKKFKLFILNFKTENSKLPKYKTLLEELSLSQESILNIDCKDLYNHDKEFYKQLVNFPQEIIPLMDICVQEVVHETFPDFSHQNITVRTFNLVEVQHMRGLGPENIDNLICIRGMVTRVSEVIPDVKSGYFRCSLCHFSKEVIIDRGRIDEPGFCESCSASGSMALVHNRCYFSDKQLIKLQETPETIPEGETPHTVNLCVFDSLVDAVKPGDRIDVTGIYRAVGKRMNPKSRSISTIFRNYIDVIHFKKTGMRLTDAEETEKFTDESSYSLESDDKIKISPEDEKKIKNFAKQPDLYEKLTTALAPSIYKMDDVKKGILCQLFGGVNKKLPNSKIRGELHILMMGDPGVSKSQLLIYVNKIAPRGIYTSGKGSSAVGLTAYIMRDQDSGELVLESGALVLSDMGICCIDEFDKMSESARSILHEVMEQQTLSVAKAGIICSLNARTSILAAANPKESKYNENLSIVENIQLPPTLLSRFDLIYLLKDSPDKQKDRKLAKHIIALFHEDYVPEESLDAKFLTQYIAYAKKNINPIITEEASDLLVKSYADLRRLGMDRKQVSATTRQLESLIRLSESLARMRLSKFVEKSDVIEALRLVKVSIFKAAIDPKSGEIDMDLITTGHTKEEREKVEQESVDENIEF